MSSTKHSQVDRGFGKMIFNNFAGGVAWGVGVTIGASFLLAVLGYFASNIGIVPVIGKFIQDILVFLSENSPR